MSGAVMQKVDRHTVFEEFIQEVLGIEQRSDIKQKEKTRRFQAAAKRVRNALFYDKRKFGEARRVQLARAEAKKLLKHHATAFGGLITQLQQATTGEAVDEALEAMIAAAAEAGDSVAQDDFKAVERQTETRLAVSTYSRYITELKNKLRDKNLRHHSLLRVVTRYKKQFPAYLEFLETLETTNANEASLVRIQLLEAAMAKADQEAYAAFTKIETDHEACQHLYTERMERSTLDKEQAESLKYRKTHTIKLNPDGIIAIAKDLLTEATKGDGYSYSRLAIGVALATGRRAVEVLYTGKFSKVDDHTLQFVGQAKKRPGTDQKEKMTIPTLLDADMVLEGISRMRSTPELIELRKRVKEKPTEREGRNEVNRISASTLNKTIKRVFGEPFSFKDTRAIYARMAHDRFFRTGTWVDMDEDEFFRNVLGHDDYETIKAYRCIQLDKHGLDLSPATNEVDVADSLVEAICKLDVEQEKSGIKGVHAFVKFAVTYAPGTPITQTLLNKRAGDLLQRLREQDVEIPTDVAGTKAFSRPLVQKYLEMAAIVISPYNAACESE